MDDGGRGRMFNLRRTTAEKPSSSSSPSPDFLWFHRRRCCCAVTFYSSRRHTSEPRTNSRWWSPPLRRGESTVGLDWKIQNIITSTCRDWAFIGAGQARPALAPIYHSPAFPSWEPLRGKITQITGGINSRFQFRRGGNFSSPKEAVFLWFRGQWPRSFRAKAPGRGGQRGREGRDRSEALKNDAPRAERNTTARGDDEKWLFWQFGRRRKGRVEQQENNQGVMIIIMGVLLERRRHGIYKFLSWPEGASEVNLNWWFTKQRIPIGVHTLIILNDPNWNCLFCFRCCTLPLSSFHKSW